MGDGGPGMPWGVLALVLFAAAATEKGTQTVFYVKLTLIALALTVLMRIRRIVFDEHATEARDPRPERRPALALTSLVLWVGAITAGRLMAYLH